MWKEFEASVERYWNELKAIKEPETNLYNKRAMWS